MTQYVLVSIDGLTVGLGIVPDGGVPSEMLVAKLDRPITTDDWEAYVEAAYAWSAAHPHLHGWAYHCASRVVAAYGGRVLVPALPAIVAALSRDAEA